MANRYLLLFIPLPLDCDFLYITFLPALVRCVHLDLQAGFNLAESAKKPFIVLGSIIPEHRRYFALFLFIIHRLTIKLKKNLRSRHVRFRRYPPCLVLSLFIFPSILYLGMRRNSFWTAHRSVTSNTTLVIGNSSARHLCLAQLGFGC